MAVEMSIECCDPCPDVLVVPLLRNLRTCVAEQLAFCGRLPCRFPITWGEQIPPADACDCFCDSGQGQAWARWVSTEPADLGGKALQAAGCADGTFEITAEVGLYRCWPVPGDAKPLEEADEEHAALGLLTDAAALRRALTCCGYLEERQWELVKEEPVGHSGGCTGVSIQLRVIGSDCDCGDSFSRQRRAQQVAPSWLGGRAA